MPTTLTVMGWEREGGQAHFCHAIVRPARGTVEYEPLLLTEDDRLAQARGTAWSLGISELSLRIWSVQLDAAAELALHAEIDGGSLTIPANCPIAPETVLTGTRFGPIPVAETEHSPARCKGVGLLRVDGFALVEGGERFVEGLRAELGRPDIGEEVNRLAAAVVARAGLGKEAQNGHSIAIVERLRRAEGMGGPRLFSVRVVKPAPASQEPTQMLRVRRLGPCDATAGYTLAIEARCHDVLVASALLHLAPGQDEAHFDAGTHVTAYRYTAFAGDGTAIEAVSGSFLQEVLGQMVGQVGIDVLPTIPGAPGNSDLEYRARLVTDALDLISAGDRAGGLDVVRQIKRTLDAVAGRGNWQGAVRWFDNSSGNQAEVVRYIKRLLEDASVDRAILVDPFLGNNAFERVVIRQGREDLRLTVLISPGDVDPEAERLDAPGRSERHIARLRASLEGFQDRTCGEVRLVHLRRGEGAGQAFHDRYLVLFGRDDVPKAYLLSNSLNEAAGRWPYALAELDRRSSWTVRRYVEDLLDGRDRDRTLTVEQVWPAAQETRSASAVLDRHHDAVAWLSAGRSDWVAAQSWAGPALDQTALTAYRDHVVRRWREAPPTWPLEAARTLADLAAFEVEAGLHSLDVLEPILTESWARETTRTVLDLIAQSPTGDWEHGRQEANALFEPGPIFPGIAAAAMRAPGRFAEPGRVMLIVLLLSLDPSGVAEFLAEPGTPPHLRLAAMTAAVYRCVAEGDAALAERFSAAQSPGLRLLALTTFDRELSGWVPHDAALEAATGLERLTLLAAAVTATLVRASGRLMQDVPDEEYEAEKATRDAAHAASIVALAERWPEDVDPSTAASVAWAGVWQRLDTAARLADALREVSKPAAADALDNLAAQDVLEHLLAPEGRVGPCAPPALAVLHCAGSLRRTGRTLARRERPTDLVRDRLNAPLAVWLSALETDILDGRDEFGAVLGCLSISAIALEIVNSATEVRHRFRSGVAIDHVRAVARALRSAAVVNLFSPHDGERSLDSILVDALAVLAEVAAIQGVGAVLAELQADPDIPTHLKERLPR